jgi:hypothetical protein
MEHFAFHLLCLCRLCVSIRDSIPWFIHSWLDLYAIFLSSRESWIGNISSEEGNFECDWYLLFQLKYILRITVCNFNHRAFVIFFVWCRCNIFRVRLAWQVRTEYCVLLYVYCPNELDSTYPRLLGICITLQTFLCKILRGHNFCYVNWER